MRKGHQLFRFPLLLGWMLLTCGVGMVVQHPVAHAAAFLPPGYSLSVTESASTMTYGGAAPSFQAQLTVPAGENPLSNPALFNFIIDSQDYAPDASGSSGSMYTFTLNSRTVTTALIPAGQHAVVASYFSVPLKQTLQSAPITLTVQKLTPSIYCQLNLLNPFAVNAPVTFTMSSSQGGGPAVDWQDATYTLTFVGPQTFTDTNLAADSNGQGTALTPPVPGNYKYQCTFNGTQNFNSAQSGFGSTLVVTAGHQTAIKLYSNPTTIQGGASATLYVVISGTSGLPTPTGQIGLGLGTVYNTRAIDLGSNGSVTVQISFPVNPPNTLRVSYFGDTVYAASYADFSLTNPPIPGGTNPNPNPTSPPTNVATATPVTGSTTPPASSSTPAASSTAIANVGAASGSHPTDPPSNQGALVFWIGLIGLLVLVALSGVFIVLRKRAKAAATSATPILQSFEDW